MKKVKLFAAVLCFLILGSFLYNQKQASDCVNQRREVIEAIFSGRGYMFADTEDITEALNQMDSALSINKIKSE